MLHNPTAGTSLADLGEHLPLINLYNKNKNNRVNVHNLAQLQIGSLVKKGLWSSNHVPSFKLIDDQNPLGL
jgi:hypothetical protein